MTQTTLLESLENDVMIQEMRFFKGSLCGCEKFVESFEKNWLNHPDKPLFGKELSIPYKWCKEALETFEQLKDAKIKVREEKANL